MTEKEILTETALIQATADHDWRWFEDRVDDLEDAVVNLKDGIVKEAVALVVIQIYLNQINRDLDEE